MQVVSSFIPFPPIAIMANILQADGLVLDKCEHYEKMSFRNKYCISGANNPNQLSIPLVNGRNQRNTMASIAISNTEKWQQQHWRTLTSVYRQTPYWEYYEPSLEDLYTRKFEYLTEFSLASLNWVVKMLKVKLNITETTEYLSNYAADYLDLRKVKPGNLKFAPGTFPEYYQIFKDRIGFLPNLSILDLMFSEGPMTKNWLETHAQQIHAV